MASVVGGQGLRLTDSHDSQKDDVFLQPNSNNVVKTGKTIISQPFGNCFFLAPIDGYKHGDSYGKSGGVW